MRLDPLTSDALAGVRHGFFSRRGGASTGIFHGLNCGGGSSDLAATVALNRERVAQSLGVAHDHLVTVHQIHSARVVLLEAPPGTPGPKADGLVTATAGLALAVLTADCMPVLFADRRAGVIGAAHAGWRGARDGVLERTIKVMERAGAARSRITAVIGPSISQRAYEVGPEFIRRFLDADADTARFFTQGTGDRYLFDLPGYGLMRLRTAGVGRAEWTRHCTCSDPARFYSCRRAHHQGHADYGRLISAIRL
ncbi:MAG: peptidoglycan editing factor PgeF [Rhodobacteraceae bacterium]|nr:peptidoglycan editing factor PgeF [Paracoccaceae bacterium]